MIKEKKYAFLLENILDTPSLRILYKIYCIGIETDKIKQKFCNKLECEKKNSLMWYKLIYI